MRRAVVLSLLAGWALWPAVSKASMVTDNKDNPASVKTVDTTVVRGGSLGIELREGGGFIARLSRK